MSHPALPPDLISFVHLAYFFCLQWFWVDSNGESSSCGSDSGKRGWRRRRRTRRRRNGRTRRRATSRKPPPTTTTSSTITQQLPTLTTKPTTPSHQKSLLRRRNLATTARPTRKDASMETCCHRWAAAASLFPMKDEVLLVKKVMHSKIKIIIKNDNITYHI